MAGGARSEKRGMGSRRLNAKELFLCAWCALGWEGRREE